jgi:NADH dehydrogenase
MTGFEEHSGTPGAGVRSVALAGGSGFIGGYLALALLQRGYRVHLLTHRIDPGFVSIRGQVETFSGAIEDEGSLLRCFERCDTVYHLVGIIAETRTSSFRRTVAEGTAHMVAAARAAGVRKIIYLSAIGADPASPIAYFNSKGIAERQVVSSGLDYTIFRPSIVYGIGDKFINRLAALIRKSPVIPVIGSGQYRLQPVYVEELCALMAASAELEITSRKIYEIGGPAALTYLEIIDIIKRVLSRRRPVVHLPMLLARGAAAVMQRMVKPSPLTVDMLKMLEAGSICDQAIAEREFGVTFTSLETQLVKYLGKRDGRQRI